jgi:hypothetical protein
MLSYFVNQDWRNKDDFLLVTVRFITVDFFQYVFFISAVLNLFGLHLYVPYSQLILSLSYCLFLPYSVTTVLQFHFLLTDVLRYTLVRPLL